MNLEVGQSVTWLHYPRGGYGYLHPVDAVVTKINPKTVEIEAPLRSGGTKRVRVKPENLRVAGQQVKEDG